MSSVTSQWSVMRLSHILMLAWQACCTTCVLGLLAFLCVHACMRACAHTWRVVVSTEHSLSFSLWSLEAGRLTECGAESWLGWNPASPSDLPIYVYLPHPKMGHLWGLLVCGGCWDPSCNAPHLITGIPLQLPHSNFLDLPFSQQTDRGPKWSDTPDTA